MVCEPGNVHYLHGLAIGGIIGAFFGALGAATVLALLIAGRDREPRIDVTEVGQRPHLHLIKGDL